MRTSCPAKQKDAGISAEQDESFTVGMATNRWSAWQGLMFDVLTVDSGLERERRERERERGEENRFDPARLRECSLSPWLLFYCCCILSPPFVKSVLHDSDPPDLGSVFPPMLLELIMLPVDDVFRPRSSSQSVCLCIWRFWVSVAVTQICWSNGHIDTSHINSVSAVHCQYDGGPPLEQRHQNSL